MDDTRCPCLSGDPYEECCGPVHRGARRAATAEALMRSRYAAFARGDVAWLRASWHPGTRPDTLEHDDHLLWRRLDILGTRRGGPFDDDGEVEFVALWRDAVTGRRGRLHEVSRFVREGGVWLYVDGVVREGGVG